MPPNGPGLSHFHKRRKLKTYPHPNKLKNILDKAIYFVAVGSPVLTIPQLMKIWADRNASGVSVITWTAYFVAASFWLAYGIVHREKPIILTNTLWILVTTLVIIGTIRYG